MSNPFIKQISKECQRSYMWVRWIKFVLENRIKTFLTMLHVPSSSRRSVTGEKTNNNLWCYGGEEKRVQRIVNNPMLMISFLQVLSRKCIILLFRVLVVLNNDSRINSSYDIPTDVERWSRAQSECRQCWIVTQQQQCEQGREMWRKKILNWFSSFRSIQQHSTPRHRLCESCENELQAKYKNK